MGPCAGIIVEKSRGGDKRHHLEDTATESMLHIITVACHQFDGNDEREDANQKQIEFKLGVLAQQTHLTLDDREIKQREIDT